MIIKKTKKDYVNNKDFLQAIMEYKEACAVAIENGQEKPQIPNYIGDCIFQISHRTSMRPNFSGYPFREDMVMDGVENCLLYFDNFDPEKTSNPFGYFTQIIWYAFLRRIAKEKKQLYLRYASSSEMLALNGTYTGGEDITVHLNTDVEYMNTFMKDYEEKMNKNKVKKDTNEDSDIM